MKDEYAQYIRERNIEGSNKASSYIRALDLLDEILRRSPLFDCPAFWTVDSVETIDRLYEFALANQAREGSVLLHDSLPPSYGRNGYYSAALKSYKEFLILKQHQDVLWHPANGLCLSATYDAAFDQHLISFDEDYRMIFSPSLKAFYSNKAFQTQFKAFEGQAIMLPNRYAPDQQLLAKHREKLVA
jgi:hypothetical protein